MTAYRRKLCDPGECGRMDYESAIAKLEAALRVETEACAAIADAWAMSDDETEAATASDIAKAIRRRKEG